MKLVYLYITPFFPSPRSWRGGYCLDAVKALTCDGRYDVRVIVPSVGDDYEWDGLCVMKMRRISAPCGLMPFALDWINNLIFKNRLDKAGIRVDEVAVCHANTLTCAPYAAYFKRLNPKAKTVVQFHSCYAFSLRSGRLGVLPIHATLLYLYYRSVCESVDALVFISELTRKTFGMRYVCVPEGEKCDIRNLLWFGRFLRRLHRPAEMVVYNGVDHSRFYSKVVRHNGFVIGCVANFQPLKDHMTLLRAVNLLKNKIEDLKVRLIGSGETWEQCKNYVHANSLEDIVTFEREIDHRNMPDFYRSIDLLVMPSRLDGFLCVGAESSACGAPAIVTLNIGLAEIVPNCDREKWLFEPLNSVELAEKILGYYHNRWKQHFTIDLDINRIWRDFLGQL